MTEKNKEYNPNDYVFSTSHAKRFVKKLSNVAFYDWTREYKVKFIKRGKENFYLRPDLIEALETEMRINGEHR
jgi:hypothetical protein